MEPWEGPPVPRVNTLFELSFKIAAMLCDYFVRRTFTSHLFGEVVIWHYRQFLLAHHSLQHDFGWPEKLSFWLLPRLPTNIIGRIAIHPKFLITCVMTIGPPTISNT